MDWIDDFYSKTGRWWGPAEARISERDHQRVRLIESICGAEPRSVLELGSGYGTTAAATADAGHTVMACELSDRIDFARQFESSERAGLLKFVKGDFYTVNVDGPYQVVAYWNGFGIGTDADQRRLLSRIADEWLDDGGRALIDVGNPFVRASWDGDEEHRSASPERGYAFTLDEVTTYDPVHNRFIDTWRESDNSESVLSQTLRNYTPADLSLLLEGTGLILESIVVGGQHLDLDASHPGNTALLRDEQEYLAVLVPG